MGDDPVEINVLGITMKLMLTIFNEDGEHSFLPDKKLADQLLKDFDRLKINFEGEKQAVARRNRRKEREPEREEDWDWEAVPTESGEYYYSNYKTGKTQWEKPDVIRGQATGDYKDVNGKGWYHYDSKTETTTRYKKYS